MIRVTEEEYQIAINESPDRSAGIVATSLVEHILDEAIMGRLLPMSNTYRDALFGGDTSFSSFSAKIDLGFSLRIFGNQTKTDMHLIRKIRNQFAHHIGRSFEHPKIIKLCVELKDYRGKGAQALEKNKDHPIAAEFYSQFPGIDMRWRFLFAITEIGLGMMREVTEVEYAPPNPTFLP